MTLKDQVLSDLSEILFNPDESAVVASYTPAGGEASEVVVIVESRSPSVEQRVGVLDVVVLVQVADVARPRPGDVIEIDGAEHVVREIVSGDGLVWTVRAA